MLHQAERLVRAADAGNEKELVKEMVNVGHRGWDPLKYPDWVLLEPDSHPPHPGTRPLAMMDLPEARNHVMQLNMGEGKSSVIVPMLTATLADGSRLVRIIVTKPQAKLMRHTLTRTLGGLLDRKVLELPFSREFRLEKKKGALYVATLYRECVENRGVILTQPEHILSLKLLGIGAAMVSDRPRKTVTSRKGKQERETIKIHDETESDENNTSTPKEAVDSILETLRLFDRTSRDIIDESDENLGTKSELIFPVGSRGSIDFSPKRWQLIQLVLGLIAEIAPSIAQEHSCGLSVVPSEHAGCFPKITILRESVVMPFMSRLAQRIGDGGLPGYSHLALPEPRFRESVIRYVTKIELEESDVIMVEGQVRNKRVYAPLLLLRGLMACGVLSASLQKRWRVNYGRVYDRKPPTRLAVPYRAKDSPAPRSEFSHPDIVIVLTCLSYYYAGLRDCEVFEVLKHLSTAVGGAQEYAACIGSAPDGAIPAAFHQLSAIDLQDTHQCTNDIFPHLCYLKRVIDYYLSEIVFPREMVAFPHKLSESPWSLVETKLHPTTGFSGTNDAKYLLPLAIESLDGPEQRGTSALVLSLLRPENYVEDIVTALAPDDERPKPLSPPQQLLDSIVHSKTEIRVLIDEGAQITELENEEVARLWLEMIPRQDHMARIKAVIFFNDDEILVLERDGTAGPFLASPYTTNMEAYLVFLDEVHTRGTDLSLPKDFRAAVTLGPRLTKDRLAQGM